MANKKLLQEAIQAFANGDKEVADKKMRTYFIEAASEINSKLEEEMDSDEENLEEDMDSDPEEDMTGSVKYKLGEDEEHNDDDEELEEGLFSPDINADGNSINIGSGSSSGNMNEEDEDPIDNDEDDDADDNEFGSDEHEESTELPDSQQWEKIIDAFDALSSMFDEIESGDGVDFDDENDENDEVEPDDDFDDVEFGDTKMGESFEMKRVSEPDKKEHSGVNKKSPVAKNAKSPIDGVKPVVIKDGNVEVTDDKFKNSDSMDAKVEDNNNVMPNANNVMKPAKTPKNTAEKSKSVLPNKSIKSAKK